MKRFCVWALTIKGFWGPFGSKWLRGIDQDIPRLNLIILLSIPWHLLFIYLIPCLSIFDILLPEQNMGNTLINCLTMKNYPLLKINLNAFLQNLSNSGSRRNMTITRRTAIIFCVETHPQSPDICFPDPFQ
jgi:hypothetical protein